jgi:septal ring factor EnvC (AmiA/AmiB activator)
MVDPQHLNQVASLLAKEQACKQNHQDQRRLEEELTRLRSLEDNYKWDLDQTQDQNKRLHQQIEKLEHQNAVLRKRLASSRLVGSFQPDIIMQKVHKIVP